MQLLNKIIPPVTFPFVLIADIEKVVIKIINNAIEIKMIK